MTEDEDIEPCPYCGAPVEQFSPGGKWHYACDCQDPVKGVTNAMMYQEKLRLCKALDERNAAYRALAWAVDDAGIGLRIHGENWGAYQAARAFVESEKKETEE